MELHLKRRHDDHLARLGKCPAILRKIALPGLFSDRRKRDRQDDEDIRAQLYQQIACLKVELDWLKNKPLHENQWASLGSGRFPRP